MLAVSNGDAEIAALLLAAGALAQRANEHGLTPLIFAASNAHDDLVSNLVSSGAELDACAAELAPWLRQTGWFDRSE